MKKRKRVHTNLAAWLVAVDAALVVRFGVGSVRANFLCDWVGAWLDDVAPAALVDLIGCGLY